MLCLRGLLPPKHKQPPHHLCTGIRAEVPVRIHFSHVTQICQVKTNRGCTKGDMNAHVAVRIRSKPDYLYCISSCKILIHFRSPEKNSSHCFIRTQCYENFLDNISIK